MKTTRVTIAQKKEQIVSLLTEMEFNESRQRMEPTFKARFAIERALIVIFERQTAEEQNAEVTVNKNGIGFTGIDADFYSKIAKEILGSKKPNGQRINAGLALWFVTGRRITKYWNQLLDAAAAKNAAKVAA